MFSDRVLQGGLAWALPAGVWSGPRSGSGGLPRWSVACVYHPYQVISWTSAYNEPQVISCFWMFLEHMALFTNSVALK